MGRKKSEHELRSLCSQLLTVEGKEAREADEASETLERMERYGQPDSKKQRDLLELVEDAGYKRANAPLWFRGLLLKITRKLFNTRAKVYG